MSVESTLKQFIENLTRPEIIVKILVNTREFKAEKLYYKPDSELKEILLNVLIEKEKNIKGG